MSRQRREASGSEGRWKVPMEGERGVNKFKDHQELIRRLVDGRKEEGIRETAVSLQSSW